MNREISFIIYEKPIPLQRHRHNHRCTYDPQKDEKTIISFLIKEYLAKSNPHFNGSCLNGPLHATFKFYFKLPKTKALRNKKGLYHHQKPDLSNLIKFYEDVMNELIYNDDAQIFKIDAIKCYTHDNPRTEITIKELSQADIIFKEAINELTFQQAKADHTKQQTFEPARLAK